MIRTVPNQNNENMLNLCKNFLLFEFNKLGTINSIQIKTTNIADHWLMDYNIVIFKCCEKSILEHLKIKPFYIRECGSGPPINFLHHRLNFASILQFPMGQYMAILHFVIFLI